jgi:hypothetical protein
MHGCEEGGRLATDCPEGNGARSLSTAPAGKPYKLITGNGYLRMSSLSKSISTW